MTVIIIMIIGIIIGLKIFPEKWHKKNQYLQVVCVAILIFSMGVKLGSRDNFLKEISEIGLSSLILAIVPILFSVIFVYILTEKYLKKTDVKKHEGEIEE